MSSNFNFDFRNLYHQNSLSRSHVWLVILMHSKQKSEDNHSFALRFRVLFRDTALRDHKWVSIFSFLMKQQIHCSVTADNSGLELLRERQGSELCSRNLFRHWKCWKVDRESLTVWVNLSSLRFKKFPFSKVGRQLSKRYLNSKFKFVHSN